nr:hypothetical protein Iba_chr07aCG7900 [Ipomoea batatas]
MENSKTLSSQRYTEDHDLLKRSMRKSKHGDGNPESSAIEIAGGSGTIDEKGSQEMGSVDVVAKTLMEEQATLDIEASRTATTAMSPELPNDLVANQLPDPSPSPLGEELDVKAPRSYLDTVISNDDMILLGKRWKGTLKPYLNAFRIFVGALDRRNMNIVLMAKLGWYLLKEKKACRVK